MEETRIKLDMDMKDVVVALAEGNPGAIRACVDLVEQAVRIDPDSALGVLGPFILLDMRHIYGADLYMLWNDVCSQDVVKMIAILRARQLGGLAGTTDAALKHAIQNRGEGLDLDAILTAFRSRLPRFAGEAFIVPEVLPGNGQEEGRT